MEKETIENCSKWLIRVPLMLVAIFLFFFLCTVSGVSFPLVMVLYALIVIGFITEVVLLVVCRKSHAKAGPAMFVLLIVALVALAFPQRNAFKTKAYDAAAKSDIRNAVGFCEEYYAYNQKYPENLDKFGEGTSDKPSKGPSKGVTIEYVMNKDKDTYVITTHHPQGREIYKWISDKPGILYRLKKKPDSAYRPL